MFATLNWPSPAIVTKVNTDPNNNCVEPFVPLAQNYLRFDISCDANGYPLYDVILVDYLPPRLEYYSSNKGGYYDEQTHTVTWILGDLAPDYSDTFRLTCKVRDEARPCETITNTVVLDSEYMYYTQATCDVQVCPYGGQVIFVDEDATGLNNGISWDNAYTDLQDALAAARNCAGAVTAIWVAAGTYKPVKDINVPNYQNISFDLPDGVALIGHFGGIGTYETNPEQRNLANSVNETILEGRIGAYYGQSVQNIVTATDVDNSLVDGFTIRNAFGGAGVNLLNSTVGVVNCVLKANSTTGVNAAQFSYPDIHNCTFLDNTQAGVTIQSNCSGEATSSIFDGNDISYYGLSLQNNSQAYVEDCLFYDHVTNAVCGSNGTLTIKDCNISDSSFAGVSIGDVTTTIDNSVIKQSGSSGIECTNSDLTILRGVIRNNAADGISASGGCNLSMNRSIIRSNSGDGIDLTNNLQTTIKNSWIHDNAGAGVNFNEQAAPALVRNDTIYSNDGYGIRATQYGLDPNITNCIVSGNIAGDLFRVSGTFNRVTYCLLQGSHAGAGNRTGDPCFMNVATNPNDLHIAEASQCKNAGAPNTTCGDESDIDGEPRIAYGRVDIGGDEYYWSRADYDRDGLVNFVDFRLFANHWRGIDADTSLDDDNDVDMADLHLFCSEWLWQKAWDEERFLDGMASQGEEMFLFGADAQATDEVTVPEKHSGSCLMITDVKRSMAARRPRLVGRSDTFYSLRAHPVRERLPERGREKKAIREMLHWLDEVWMSGDLTISEQDYLQFRQSLDEMLK